MKLDSERPEFRDVVVRDVNLVQKGRFFSLRSVASCRICSVKNASRPVLVYIVMSRSASRMCSR